MVYTYNVNCWRRALRSNPSKHFGLVWFFMLMMLFNESKWLFAIFFFAAVVRCICSCLFFRGFHHCFVYFGCWSFEYSMALHHRCVVCSCVHIHFFNVYIIHRKKRNKQQVHENKVSLHFADSFFVCCCFWFYMSFITNQLKTYTSRCQQISRTR